MWTCEQCQDRSKTASTETGMVSCNSAVLHKSPEKKYREKGVLSD